MRTLQSGDYPRPAGMGVLSVRRVVAVKFHRRMPRMASGRPAPIRAPRACGAVDSRQAGPLGSCGGPAMEAMILVHRMWHFGGDGKVEQPCSGCSAIEWLCFRRRQTTELRQVCVEFRLDLAAWTDLASPWGDQRAVQSSARRRVDSDSRCFGRACRCPGGPRNCAWSVRLPAWRWFA